MELLSLREELEATEHAISKQHVECAAVQTQQDGLFCRLQSLSATNTARAALLARVNDGEQASAAECRTTKDMNRTKVAEALHMVDAFAGSTNSVVCRAVSPQHDTSEAAADPSGRMDKESGPEPHPLPLPLDASARDCDGGGSGNAPGVGNCISLQREASVFSYAATRADLLSRLQTRAAACEAEERTRAQLQDTLTMLLSEIAAAEGRRNAADARRTALAAERVAVHESSGKELLPRATQIKERMAALALEQQRAAEAAQRLEEATAEARKALEEARSSRNRTAERYATVFQRPAPERLTIDPVDP